MWEFSLDIFSIYLFYMAPGAGLEPTQDIILRDFKSDALPFAINNL